jgi:hypothetical protein
MSTPKAPLAPFFGAITGTTSEDDMVPVADALLRAVLGALPLNLTKKKRGLEFKRLQAEVASGLTAHPSAAQLVFCLKVRRGAVSACVLVVFVVKRVLPTRLWRRPSRRPFSCWSTPFVMR